MDRLGGPCRVETADGRWPELNDGLTYTDRVQGACALSLLQFYGSKHATSASIEQWRQSIIEGRHSINGQVVHDPQAPIPPNAMLEHRRPGWAEPPAPAFLDVLWWDAHLVAVHKPSGLQVLPAGPVHERCALNLLRRFHREHAAELEGMPAPVHRLGRGTSGVLICCCSDAARRRLSRDFQEHGAENEGRMKKVYRTLVAGLVADDEGEIDVPIGRIEYPGIRGGLFAACTEDAPGAKPSRSHYTVLHRNEAEGTSLVDVEIFTGRPHQIRIHMAALGHPLVGDPLYAPGGGPLPLPTAQGGGQAGEEEVKTRVEEAEASQQRQQQQQRGAEEGGCSGDARAGAEGAADAAAAEAVSSAEIAQQRVVMPGDVGYLLHSMILEFNHPITGERVLATCPPPPALQLPCERLPPAVPAAAPPPP